MLDYGSSSVPLAEAAAHCPWPKATVSKHLGPVLPVRGLASAALFVFCCAWVLWQCGALAAVPVRLSNESLMVLCV